MEKVLLIISLTICNLSLHAQSLVTSFHSPLLLRAAYIEVLKTQPDGNILVGGNIDYYGNQKVHNLIRIHPDGSIDNTFNFLHDDNFIVADIELLPAGDIIILMNQYGGYNDAPQINDKIIKLKPDGTIEKEIDTPGASKALAVQADGKILLAGAQNLRRYASDLTDDTIFNNAVSFNGELTDIEVFGDNLFVAGYFSTVNGISKNNVVKLNIDGSIDNTFDIGAGTGANDFIAALTIQSNGKILLDGSIISFNGIENFHKLIRLNTDGSIDTGFSSPSVGVTSKMVVTSDGIYGCGIFQATMTDLNYRFFKLNLDGSLASDFEPIHIQPLDFFHIPMAVLDDGILIGSQSDGGNPLGLDKVDFSGNYAKNFAPEISRIGIARFGQLLEGKLLIGGDFIRIDGYKTNGLARINYDGSVDESFQLKENKGVVTQIEVLKDNTVLVLTPSVFFKTDSHGNLLPDFNWISGTDDLYQVDKFKVLNNGTIIAAGGNILLRLLDDGAVDNTFTLPIQGGDVGSTAFDFDLQGDKIIYGSIFSTLEGVPVNRIARLLNDGTVDNTFNIGSGINDPAGDGFISLVKVLNNNEILVGGVFKSFNGVSLSRSLVKLSPNGTMDMTFNQNQLLSNGIANATFMSNTVLQIGSVLFINNFYSMYVINTDGSDSNFTFPGNIQYINNIVNSSSSIEGRVQDDENYLYTIGSFQTSTSGSPSAILKMTLDKNSTPSAPGVVAGTEKSLDKSVRIYPQPVTDFLTVNTGTGNFHAEVYDTSGKNYYENNFSANNGSIFSGIGGVAENKMARILNDGSIDNTFNIGSGINDQTGNDFVGLIKVLNNNEILVGGGFKSFNGVNLNRSLVKLSVDGTIDMSFNQNQLLSDGIGGATFLYNTVLQIGSVIYISGVDFMYVINVNGSDADFTFPGEIHYVNNIVSSSSSIEGRAQDNENYLYTIGSFETFTTGSPSAILKMTLNQNSTSSNPSSPSIPSTPSVVTETEKSLDASIKIYPQPVADFLTVNTSSGNFHTEVYDISGKKYSENNLSVNTGSFLIDMQNATPGLYLLKITSASGESTVKKFLKKP